MPSNDETLFGRRRSEEVIQAVLFEGLAWYHKQGIKVMSPETMVELTRIAQELRSELKHAGKDLTPEVREFLTNMAETLDTMVSLGRVSNGAAILQDTMVRIDLDRLEGM